MVTYAQLWDMDLTKLRYAADNAGSLASRLGNRGSQIITKSNIPEGIWTGHDADAAMSLLSPKYRPLWDTSDALRDSRGVLHDLADELESAKDRLGDAHDAVAGTDAHIASDGTVEVPPGLDKPEHERATRAAKRASDIIEAAVKKANTADKKASDSLSLKTDGTGKSERQKQAEWLKENSTWGGPSIGHEEKVGPQQGKSKKHGKRAQKDADESGTTNWRVFDFQFNPNLSSDKHPFFGEGRLGAGIKGTFGKMNSLDIFAGGALGGGAEKSADLGPFTFRGEIAPRVGASAGVNGLFGIEDGKFKLGGGGELAWGAGGKMAGSMEVDGEKLNEVYKENPVKTPLNAPIAVPN